MARAIFGAIATVTGTITRAMSLTIAFTREKHAVVCQR